MAKNMARIENGIVIGIEWWADREPQTDMLADIEDLPVGVGDTYDGADFYHNGEKVLSEAERLQAELADAEAALAELGVSVDG